jgi:osmotically-inducible protein OsmY
MKRHQALLGILAMLALALAPACRRTAEGAKEDTRENAEKAKEGSQKLAEESKEAAGKMSDEAAEAGKKIGEAAGEAGHKIGEAAKDVGHVVKEGAKEVASEVGAKSELVEIKTALMAEKSIDASHIDVDTDAKTKTVTLKGSVATQDQKATAGRIAKEKAPGYTVVNHLSVGARPSGRPPSD